MTADSEQQTGGYVRHRDRMVQESFFQDLQSTLIACRWMAGTTARAVIDPNNPAGWVHVTTTDEQILPLAGKREDGTPAPIVLIDYFPEAGGDDDAQGKSRKTELNTMAVDTGVPQPAVQMELGSNMEERPYVFTLVFYASSDAVALAVMNDLRDRYAGRIVSDDHLDLFNFNDPDFEDFSAPVVRMEIVQFRYERNEQTVAPWEAHLYYAEVTVNDVVDPGMVT